MNNQKERASLKEIFIIAPLLVGIVIAYKPIHTATNVFLTEQANENAIEVVSQDSTLAGLLDTFLSHHPNAIGQVSETSNIIEFIEFEGANKITLQLNLDAPRSSQLICQTTVQKVTAFDYIEKSLQSNSECP